VPVLVLALWLWIGAAELGVDATTSGLRPAWPLGVSARKVSFTRGSASLPLKDLELLWSPGGWRGEARLDAGRVRLYARSGGGAAIAYARDLPLDRLELSGLRFSGLATGVVRWRDGVFEIGGQARRGSLSVGPPPALGVAYDVVDALASVSPSGRIVLGRVQLSGATLVMAAAGTLDPEAGLDLRLRIERLEEPLRSALALSGLRVRQLPALLAVRGSLAAPSVTELDVR
jgi:hypothetical protein